MIGLTLADVLEHDVRQFGNREAVTIDDRSMSFVELAQLAAAARATLGGLLGEGDRVAIALPNSFAWIAFFLAAAGLKAVSVPINTRLTPAELRVILEDADATVLVTAENYRGRTYVEEALSACDDLLTHVVAVTETEWQVIPTGASSRPTQRVEAAGVFCIQYTSGTTATPKGVMLTEAAYLQTASWVARCQMLTPATSFMSAAPFFHCSGSMHAVTTNLLAGSTLHSVSIWDPDHFLDLIQRHRGQASHGVFFRDIVSLGSAVGDRLATLKVGVDIGGPDFVRRLHDEFGITGISNIYGMTEQCGNFAMWFPDDPLDQRIVLSGRSQPGNRVRIADPATGAPLPPGAEGEIQMRGPTVSPGYFKRPDANRAAFTEDGWFRSGDSGSLTPDRALHFRGRLRDIIRVGGENVSPSEVESAVARHTGLKQLSVIGVPDQRLGEVVALVVTDSVALDWPAALEAMSRDVAGFKLPKQVWAADEFPMTATNKVQRATLQRWVGDGRLRRLA